MTIPLRVLIVEDSEDDALLIVRELKRGGYEPIFERVDTAEAMSEALAKKTWDAIIADYVIPRFGGLEALRLFQKTGLDIPFIIISGKIGEDIAVETMKAGAHDYVMKSNLIKLVPAIQRELREAEIRREKKRAEEERERLYHEAQAAREQVITILESITDAFLALDHQWRVVYMNQNAEQLLRKKRSELIGRVYWEVFPDTVDTIGYRELHRAVAEDVTVEYEQFYPPLDTLFEARGFPSKDGINVFFRDITERKRSEELSKALNDINLTINSTLDFDKIMRKVVVEAAKAIGSDACNITLCRNGHWVVEYTYGLPQQVAGTRITGGQAAISDLISATKKPLAIKDILSEERFRHWILKEYSVRSVLGIPLLVREEVIGILYFTYSSVKPDFSRAEIDFAEKLSASVLLAIQNAHLFEESKRAEEELRRRTEDLARANAELEQFTNIAAHDLQEPLRIISLFTQLLERRYKGRLDKDADEFISYTVDGAKHMQQMIEDLRAYSRIGTSGKPFELTDFETVLDQAIANLKTAIEENKAQVTHDLLPTVMADASQMVQLFQHLISNAIKFRREEPPRVHVSAQRKRNDWVFSIRDNGIGISPEFMGHLFKIFKREHVAKYPGTGAGLAICKRIVERHGGRIWAESEVGKGTIFYFTIPLRLRTIALAINRNARHGFRINTGVIMEKPFKC